MEFIVDTSLQDVNFAPDPVEEILQNVKYIMITMKYSVPLDRLFGISGEFIDKPPEIARAIYSAEIIQKIHRHEPRATVTDVISAERVPGEFATGRFNAAVKVRVDA